MLAALCQAGWRVTDMAGIRHHQQEAWQTLFLMLAGFDLLCPAPFLASTRSIISSVALCAAAFFSASSAGESLGSRKSEFSVLSASMSWIGMCWDACAL